MAGFAADRMDSILRGLDYYVSRSSNSGEVADISFLCRELRMLNGALQDFDTTMMERNMQVKEWTRQVRELTYDVEDCMDFHKHQVGRKPRQILAAIVSSAAAAALRSNRFGLDKQFQQLKYRVIEVAERLKRYGLTIDLPAVNRYAPDADRGSSSVAIDPRLPSDPVAIDGSTKEIIQLLTDEETHVKVASIVGMAGVGKTTLAMQVHRAMKERFDCLAFVHVGRRPSIKMVLMNIIRQVTRHLHLDVSADEAALSCATEQEAEAMERLRILLRGKRYLIIIDDIWSISSWKGINCALPQSNTGSRIIVTTRIHDVARSCSNHPCDSIYVVKTLSVSDSLKLFHSRIFGSEDKCQKECGELHESVLKTCVGLPWTITVVASILAKTAPHEWEMVNKSTLLGIEQYAPLQRMSKILHLSYTDLPFPIKSCLLYLSVFPKNYKISKDNLIWRWIAEGFISEESGGIMYETGISYFNELINRSLIQPVHADDEDDPVGCMVHGTVHDFIVSLSSEENFVTLDEKLKSRPLNAIRRLSLNYTKEEESGADLELDLNKRNLSVARSLTVLGQAQRMPHLASFQLLRVLDLEGTEGLESRRLRDIGKLFNLRYLGLGGERLTKLPNSIRNLQLLETLEFRRTKITTLPRAAAQLQKLVRLMAKDLDSIPVWLGEMKALQELSMISVKTHNALISFVAELAKLRQLRVLGVKWCFEDNLTSGQPNGCSLDFLADRWNPPCRLEKLVMESSSSCFPRIPRNLSECQHLNHLDIAINLDREEDLLIIASLPSLTVLKLSVRGKPITITTKGFGFLKVFLVRRWESDLGLVFEAGAMPCLRKLYLHFNVISQKQHDRFVPGLQYLSSLKQIKVKIDCDGAMPTEVASVEQAIKKDTHVNGKKIRFELSRENEEKMKQDERQEHLEQLLPNLC